MKKKYCKTCGKEININSIYCSNKCKFADAEYNKNRCIKQIKNIKNTIAQCKICGWKTNDTINISGVLYKHLKSHNISKLDMTQYKIKQEIPIEMPKLKCPYCNWTTIDIENKSGWFTTHLNKKHNKTPEDIVKEYPEMKKLWKLYFQKANYNKHLELKENYIECEICGKRFKKLSNSHLKSHGLTPSQYKEKYHILSTTSENTSKIMSNITKQTNIKLMEYYRKNNIPMAWHTEDSIKIRMRNGFEIYKKRIEQEFEMLFDFDDYYNNIKDFKFICKKCGNKIETDLKYPRCLICNPLLNGTSKEEIEILNFLKNDLKLEVEERNRKLISKEIDIFVPKYNIGIEFDGLYWHSESISKHSPNYHIEKTNACEKLGIKLIHIFGDEWDSKKDIVKERLIHIFNITENKKIIGARETIIKEIDSIDASKFLDKYHIQGSIRSSIKLGAFYINDLVAVMTFGHLRRSLGNTEKIGWELYRFATNYDYIIRGIGGKLFNHFVNNYNPEYILTYADRRWSSNIGGNFYEKIGFKYTGNTSINYWYTKNYLFREHRFAYRKSILLERYGPSDKTEWQIMQENGYDRIWDCGNMKFEWHKN